MGEGGREGEKTIIDIVTLRQPTCLHRPMNALLLKLECRFAQAVVSTAEGRIPTRSGSVTTKASSKLGC